MRECIAGVGKWQGIPLLKNEDAIVTNRSSSVERSGCCGLLERVLRFRYHKSCAAFFTFLEGPVEHQQALTRRLESNDEPFESTIRGGLNTIEVFLTYIHHAGPKSSLRRVDPSGHEVLS